MEKNGIFLCWAADELELAQHETILSPWEQMKELPKITAQEAADKLGITLDELKELQ